MQPFTTTHSIHIAHTSHTHRTQHQKYKSNTQSTCVRGAILDISFIFLCPSDPDGGSQKGKEELKKVLRQEIESDAKLTAEGEL